MIFLPNEKMRTVKFIDTVCASKKEIFLRTGMTFSGNQFTGDNFVGKLNKTMVESIIALNASLEEAAGPEAGSDE